MFELKFNTENAAFADDAPGAIAAALQEVAESIRSRILGDEDTGGIWDANGNRIGSWHYREA